MELNLAKVPGQAASLTTVTVDDKVFGCEYKPGLIHQVVTAYRAYARSGSSAQKSRSEVSGGGKKPWKQKGTGQARAGSNTSPIWRGGGVTFAAKPTCYAQKINKKMYKTSIRSILSELLRQNRLQVIESFDVTTHKTKDFVNKLSALDLDKVLIISDKIEPNLYLASRNLHKVAVLDVAGVDPVSLIKFSKVLITVPALKQLEEVLK
jgi:large subunit ribosomal protein L4